MIRFCDGVVYTIDVKEYTRYSLMIEILNRKLQNVLFRVVDGSQEIGTLQYADLLNGDKSLIECITSEKIIYNSDVFEKCNNFFSQHSRYKFTQVYNENDEIEYMAYIDRRQWVNSNTVLGTLKSLCDTEYITFHDYFPHIQAVYLYGVDEISYQWYCYLEKSQIPYQLIGDKWKILGNDKYIKEMRKNLQVPDFARLTINADIEDSVPHRIADFDFFKKRSVIEQYDFLIPYCVKSYQYALENQAQKLQRLGVKTCIVNIPELCELDNITEDEQYCIQNAVNLNYVNDIVGQGIEQLHEIYGLELCEAYKEGKTTSDRDIDIIEDMPVFYLNRDENSEGNTVYLFGPCVAYQADMMTKDTILARMQDYAKCKGYVRYIYCSVSIAIEQFTNVEKVIHTLNWKTGDLAIFVYFGLKECRGIDYIDMTEEFNERAEKRFFSNEPIHVNQFGSICIADKIGRRFLECHMQNEPSLEIVQYAQILESDERNLVNQFIEKNNCQPRDGICGAIVMNCNPYTRGHDYLIDKASKRVDWLYIFVVEEDASFFSFEDRFWLVCENTKKYKNVIVYPSGKMILSKKTLPAYFTKEMKQTHGVDATKDLQIFGLGIAPKLHISIRFVGEEPLDAVTRKYNEQMKQILPYYGIELQEIPRKEVSGEVISASRVRELIRKKDFGLISKLTTDITYDFLEKKYL